MAMKVRPDKLSKPKLQIVVDNKPLKKRPLAELCQKEASLNCSAIIKTFTSVNIVQNKEVLSSKPQVKTNTASNDDAPWQEDCPAYYEWLKAFSCDRPYKINKKGTRRLPLIESDSFLVSNIKAERVHRDRAIRSQKMREQIGRQLFDKSSLLDRWDEYCTHPYTSIMPGKGPSTFIVVQNTDWKGLRPPTVQQLLERCFSKQYKEVLLSELKSMLIRQPKTERHYVKKRKCRERTSKEMSVRRIRIKYLEKRKYFYTLKKFDTLNGHIDCVPFIEKTNLGIPFCTRGYSAEFAKIAPTQRFHSLVKDKHDKWMLFCEYWKAFIGGQIDHKGLEQAGKRIYSEEIDTFLPHLFPKQILDSNGNHCIEGEYTVEKNTPPIKEEVDALRRMAARRYRQVKARAERLNRESDTGKPKGHEYHFVPDHLVSHIAIAKARKNLPSLLALPSPETFERDEDKSIAV